MKTWKSFILTGAAMVALAHLPASAEPTTDIDPMIRAAERGDLPAVRAYLEDDRRLSIPNYRLNERDYWGETALHVAARNGHTEIVRYLLDKGADQNAPDYFIMDYRLYPNLADYTYYETPLHEAAKGGYTEIVKMLVEAGAQLDPLDSGGNTPLSNAAARGHLDTVKYLVYKTARVDLEDQLGHTPLWMAVVNGYVPVVEFLLASGSPVGNLDYDRLVASQVAKNDTIIQLLKKRGLH